MKFLRIQLTLTSLFALVVCSSAQTPQLSPKMAEVKEAIHYLDSLATVVQSLPVNQQRDEEVNAMVDDIVSQYEAAHPENDKSGMVASEARSLAATDAAKAWGTFKKMCGINEFEKALDFYLEKKEDGTKKNAGNFLVFFQHSSHRYVFYSKVIFPLLTEFHDRDFVLVEYTNMLQLEKALEDLTIAMNAEGNGYIPEVYPTVVSELGQVLAAQGKVDEAMGMLGDLMDTLYALTDDVMYTNYYGMMFGADIYQSLGDIESAIGIWENYIRFLKENADLTEDPDEMKFYLNKANEKMTALRSE